MTLSYGEVAEILKIIDSSDCEEVILELEGARLVVRRGASGGAAPSAAAPAPVAQPNAPAKAESAAAPAASLAAAPAAAPANDGDVVVRAPMVGTFYRRPSPDEAPFVEEGSSVKPGDAICLIEVMKLYTTIEATVAGTVQSIAVEDGTLVQFDQPLITIKPA